MPESNVGAHILMITSYNSRAGYCEYNLLNWVIVPSIPVTSREYVSKGESTRTTSQTCPNNESRRWYSSSNSTRGKRVS